MGLVRIRHATGVLLLLLAVDVAAQPYRLEVAERLPAPPDAGEPAFLLAVAAGDVDGDGRPDVVTVADGRLLAYLQAAGGGWRAVVEQPLPPSDQGVHVSVRSLAVGDFDGDGRADAVVSRDGDHLPFRGQADGSWQSMPVLQTGRIPALAARVGDIDRDGRDDLVVVEEERDPGNTTIAVAIHIYFGDPALSFSRRARIDLGEDRITALALGDFDGDQAMDLATRETPLAGGGTYGWVHVRAGDGGSRFGPRTRVDAAGQSARGLVAGDFNGDGVDDLVAEQDAFGSPAGPRFVQVAGQAGAGAVGEVSFQRGAGRLRSASVGDVDGDGRDDVVALTYGAAFLHQGRAGGFAQSERTQAAVGSYYDEDGPLHAVVDLDGDGRDDVVARATDAGLVVLRSRANPDYDPARLPGAPTLRSAVLLDDGEYANVTIGRAVGGTGLPVLGYRIDTRPGGPAGDREAVAAGNGDVVLRLAGLVESTPYQVVVRAYNAAGYGPPSNPLTLERLPRLQLWMDEQNRIPEGDAGQSVHVLKARLNVPARQGGVRFDVRSQGSSATPGEDYLPVTLTDVFIPEGQSEADVPVTVLGDTVFENDELFTVTLHNIRGAEPYDLVRMVWITEDDPGTVGDAALMVYGDAVEEGGPGEQRTLSFLVRALEPPARPVTFDLRIDTYPRETAATAGVDFDATPFRDLRLEAGQQELWVRVPVYGDAEPEYPEDFTILFENVRGGYALSPRDQAAGVILDDDRVLPPLHLREDRYVLHQNAAVATVDPLRNDIYTAAELEQAAMDFPWPAGIQRAWAINHETTTLVDNYTQLKLARNFVGEIRTRFIVCELYLAGGRCDSSPLVFVVRPLPEEPLAFEVPADAGHRDIPVSGLGPMPAARFEASPLVAPEVVQRRLPGDPSPASPWDGGREGVSVVARRIEAAATPGAWRVLAEAFAQGAGDVDLYLGVDLDLDGQADPDELRCTAAMSASAEACELDLQGRSDRPVGYWALLHNRGGAELPARLELSAVPLQGTDGSLVATGPGSLAQGEHFNLRLAWDDATWLPGERRVGYLRVRSSPDDPGALVPVRLQRAEGEPAARVLVPGQPLALRLAPGRAHERLVIDVPPGASALAFELDSAQAVDLYVSRTDPGPGPLIAAAPARAQAVVASRRAGGNEEALVEGASLAPGRWYATPVNTGGVDAAMTLRTTLVAAAPSLRFGSYFNAARSGHGLFVYPAGDQWAGLWYTYLEDGSPTWLYLQAPRPGADGIWRTPVFRSSWDGAAGHLVRVGDATLTPAAADAFQFSHRIEGVAGSEPMSSLGRGCPIVQGRVLDGSSHWFNPARSGTGYSVQLLPNYEMYIAFVYDGQGTPRFLIAEGPVLDAAERVLPLEQLEGFCPLCAREAAPVRRDVGTFLRRYGAGAPVFGLDALFLSGLPGFWTGDEAVQPLGGAGTTQGCEP